MTWTSRKGYGLAALLRDVLDSPPPGSRLVPITEERTLRASPKRVWELWTTREGFSSWWVPEGFEVTVEVFEPSVGGRIDLRYEEKGVSRNPEWGAELRAKGQTTSFTARGTFSEVEPLRRLAFQQQLDFGRAGSRHAYRLTAAMSPVEGGTMIVLTAESSPSKHWTLLGRANLRAQLDRLAMQCEPRAR